MASTFLHRAYYAAGNDYVYWTASDWDPNGTEYTLSSPSFSDLSHPVIVNVIEDLGVGGLTIYDEDLSSQTDGTTASFTLQHEPAVDILYIYVNGLLQEKDKHYTISGDTITFDPGCVPRATDSLLVIYYTGQVVKPSEADPRLNAPSETTADVTALISPTVHNAREVRESDIDAPSETIGDATALKAPPNDSPDADGFSDSTVSTGGNWNQVP